MQIMESGFNQMIVLFNLIVEPNTKEICFIYGLTVGNEEAWKKESILKLLCICEDRFQCKWNIKRSYASLPGFSISLL